MSTCLFGFTEQDGGYIQNSLSEIILLLWLCEIIFGSFEDLKVRWILYLPPTAAQAATEGEDTAEGKTALQEGRFGEADQRGEGQEEGLCVKGERKRVRGSEDSGY